MKTRSGDERKGERGRGEKEKRPNLLFVKGGGDWEKEGKGRKGFNSALPPFPSFFLFFFFFWQIIYKRNIHTSIYYYSIIVPGY